MLSLRCVRSITKTHFRVSSKNDFAKVHSFLDRSSGLVSINCINVAVERDIWRWNSAFVARWAAHLLWNWIAASCANHLPERGDREVQEERDDAKELPEALTMCHGLDWSLLQPEVYAWDLCYVLSLSLHPEMMKVYVKVICFVRLTHL